MRLKDLKVGEEYAYRDKYNWQLLRATVIELGVELKYYTYKGARIQLDSGDKLDVPAREIIRTWSEEEEKKLERAATAEKRRAKREKVKGAIDTLQEALRSIDVQVLDCRPYWVQGTPHIKVIIDIPAAEDLTYLAGVAADNNWEKK